MSKIDRGKNIQAKKIVNTILSNVSLKSTKMAITLERRNPVSSVMYPAKWSFTAVAGPFQYYMAQDGDLMH